MSGEVSERGTPSPSLPLQMRARVWRLLLERLDVPEVARRVGLSRQAVLSHAKALIHAGALERESKPRAPLRVRPGPRADAFARAVEEETTGPRGVVVAAPWKAHAWSWGIYFTSGPRVEPAGARRVEASKVARLVWVQAVEGEEWTLAAYLGKSRRTLAVYPPPVWVDAGSARAVLDQRARVAEGVLRAAGRAYGFAILGAVRQLGPAEFALPAPGLRKEGVAGQSVVWVDETPPPSSLETRALSVVEAVGELPDFMLRCARVEDDLRAQLAALLSNQEAQAKVSRLVVDRTTDGVET